MTRRKHYSKLPIQGNFYPMSSAMYIEDDITRVSLLSVQPLGASSLYNGQMEVIISLISYFKKVLIKLKKKKKTIEFNCNLFDRSYRIVDCDKTTIVGWAKGFWIMFQL